MKFLKMRNGIALVAVMTILIITSLFIPAMFNLSDTSLRVAVTGTDRQRSSYLARTITEMSVAAFKKFDSEEYTKIDPADTAARDNYTGITAEEKARLNPLIDAYAELRNGTREFINTERIYMYSTMTKGTEYFKVLKRNGVEIENKISKKDYDALLIAYEDMTSKQEDPGYTLRTYENRDIEEIVYASANTDDYTKYSTDGAYTYVGEGQCKITYDDSVQYFETDIETQAITEISESEYQTKQTELESNLKNNLPVDYSVSKKENRNVTFVSTATVNGITTSRSCVLVLQTYPSDEDWFVFGIESNGEQIASGGNQVFVDPKKATGRIPIEYDNAIGNNYIKQTLLVYSSVGNMLIKPVTFKDASGNEYETGMGNSEFVLGIQPGLNTTPNNDPTYAIIDGVNYDSSQEVAQMNNFVAFASTNAIQVDMPINLLVNPCRAKRLGDGYILGAGDPNGSLFKVMMFQAPTIQFNGRLDMMMSFYVRDNEDARRMSSIVLMAPEDTPYKYNNKDRNKVVKAGKVYFAEDCYLWIIPYGEDGSSSSWTGFLAETVYERDSDFTKIKIANAGDAYYFNADLTETVKGANGQSKEERVGFSLTGYFLETEYIPNMEAYESGSWWQIWSNTKTAIFANYMQGAFGEREKTYVKGDWEYIGNINEDPIEYPEVDDYFTIWTN
ncbi:MAG: hypothetical protein E7557_06200 [Ruminococcaceae bacterium]|nr:hypothetical protein [Oscillospiraceae bacterium]